MIWALFLLGFLCGAAFANATRRRERLDIYEAVQRRQYQEIGRELRVIKGGRR
jgi:hypothetical protein